jgi:hypothetical protein
VGENDAMEYVLGWRSGRHFIKLTKEIGVWDAGIAADVQLALQHSAVASSASWIRGGVDPEPKVAGVVVRDV